MKSFFAWNMRGFNMTRKHRALRTWLQEEKSFFGCLLETRVHENNHTRCMNAAMPIWNSLTNYEFHHLGRIWFCWSNDVIVTKLHMSAQVITCAIQIPSTGEQFICSAIYAFNTVGERMTLWEELRGTKAAYCHLKLPWIILGDFNATLSSSEHSRAMDYRGDQIGMRHFQEAITDCMVTDLPYTGALFTWWNKRVEDPIGKKLDRALVNSEWLSHYPQASAQFDAGGVSDHARCVIRVTGAVNQARKPFRFFNYLTEHPDFLATVKDVWDTTEPIYHSRSALSRFHKKLKLLKQPLRALNKTHYGDLPARTKQAYEELCNCQNTVLQDPSPENIARAAAAEEKWNRLARVEEKFYMQKSCVRWLQVGDQNTRFFHSVVQTRAARNTIRSLVNGQGEVLTSDQDIKKEAVSHFQTFLQSQDATLEETSVASLQELLTYRCSNETAAALACPVTAKEIYQALQALPNGKVSGPDGFTKEFFVAAWSIIGREFIVAVQSFFLFGFMPTGVNATILSLIPKTTNAQTMKEYRPIACCNFLYKVISKVLANRLKIIFPEAIEANQCAFITDRLLLENVLLASELVSGYHRSVTEAKCAIKFDISKAFDTVKWSFITSVLLAMGLPPQFVNWIRLCITTAAFSVSVNGSLEGFFTSARGIRQGCSLSPYLYVILNNVLSKLLNKAAAAGEFAYHPQCEGVKLTHLSFADDILVFTKGTTGSLMGVLEVMKRFARMSGLHINVAKSSIFASGHNISDLLAAAESLNIGVGTLPIRYLGMPLTTKTLTSHDYEPLIDKIRSRMLCWSNKTLSFAGRLQLIKSVIASMVNFWSQAFILPAKCLDKIESMCSAFLWSGSPTQTHKAKVSWDDLCVPKEEGGLGIRKLRETNRVFALKLIWRLFTQPTSLWVSWVKHYLLKYNSFWDVRDDTKGSWIWRKLLKLRDVAYEFLRFDIQDGNNCHFWFDDWLGQGKLIDITGPTGTTYLGIRRHAKVSDAVTLEEWSIRGSRSRRFHELRNSILQREPPQPENGKDIVLWKHGSDDYRDHYSAASTWEQVRSRRPTVEWSRVIWFTQGVPRFSFITWLAVKNRLSTGDRMRQWGMVQSCELCGERDETRDHLFFACPYSYTVWESLARRLIGISINPDWQWTLHRIQRMSQGKADTVLVKLLLQTTIYHIWRERNGRRHQQSRVTTDHMRRRIDKAVRNRISSLKYRFDHKYGGLLSRWFQLSM